MIKCSLQFNQESTSPKSLFYNNYYYCSIKLRQMLVFDEGGKPRCPGKNLLVQRREPTNSIHIWRREWNLNPGHIGGRRVLSPLGQPCHPLKGEQSELDSTQFIIPCFLLDLQVHTLLLCLSLVYNSGWAVAE